MSLIHAHGVDMYRGRFAPSPTGPLHAGSLVTALASWLDARAHGGQWVVRIEDVDRTRCTAAAGKRILQQLAACGLHSDTTPIWQSKRHTHYQQALQALCEKNLAYACACSRKEVEANLHSQGVHQSRNRALPYPGTCRNGIVGKAARTWRLRTDALPVHWSDRRLGVQEQDVETEVGDFVLLRADGFFSYQLAVVVDDAAQGISHVVRGEDLLDNTARQILLQGALSFPTPKYLHTRLVRNEQGEKLSKHTGAPAIDTSSPAAALAALEQAATMLDLHTPRKTQKIPNSYATTEAALHAWVDVWRSMYCT